MANVTDRFSVEDLDYFYSNVSNAQKYSRFVEKYGNEQIGEFSRFMQSLTQQPAARPCPNPIYEIPRIRPAAPKPPPPAVPPKPARSPPNSFFPSVSNLLILGSTGAGKSTFVNSLANYLVYRTLDEAVECGPRILIPTRFTEIKMDERNGYHDIDVKVLPNVQSEDHDQQKFPNDEDMRVGESSTQFPRSYIFPYNRSENDQQTIRVIDTPGIGDVRGSEQDQQNFARTMSFIASFDEIHAICIVIQAQQARLGVGFRFCLDELLTRLDKDAAKNIIFCFTHCSGVQFNPGDSLPTLRTHLERLRAERGIDVPLKPSNMFNFENKCFRYFCGSMNGIEYGRDEIDDFRMGWNKSRTNVIHLLNNVTTMRPHEVSKTLSINNVRVAIMALSRPLAAITKSLLQNEGLLKQREKELQESIKKDQVIEEQLTMKEIVPVKKDLDYPVTVCTNKKCVEIRHLSSGVTYTYYKQICHFQCYLTGVPVEQFPNQQLKNCIILHSNHKKCTQCSCSWEHHMHLRYHLTFEEQENLDLRIDLDKNVGMTSRARATVVELQKQIRAYNEERNKIQTMCAHFAVFLKTHCLLDYTDSYEAYSDMLIKNEEDKPGKFRNESHLKALKQQKQAYLEMINVIKNAQHTESVSIERINQMLIELKSARFQGQLLREVEDIQIKAVKEYQTRNQLRVPPPRPPPAKAVTVNVMHPPPPVGIVRPIQPPIYSPPFTSSNDPILPPDPPPKPRKKVAGPVQMAKQLLFGPKPN